MTELERLSNKLKEERELLEKLVKINKKKRILASAITTTVTLLPLISIGAGGVLMLTDGSTKHATLNYEEEMIFDPNGNITSTLLEQSRNGKKDEKEYVKIYDPYTLTEDGKYSRVFRVYTGADFTKEDVQALINGDDLNLEEVFGKNVTTGTELKTSIENDSKEPQIEATVYTLSDVTYEGLDQDARNKRFWIGLGAVAAGFAGLGILYYGCDPNNPKRDESLDKKMNDYLHYYAFESYNTERNTRDQIDFLERECCKLSKDSEKEPTRTKK